VSNVLPLQKGIVYGPVNSKRLGRSLGINLFPASKKICTYDCIYCHYGETKDVTINPDRAGLPSTEQVVSAIEQALKSDLEFDYLTFSGNGEPMLHPDFRAIVEKVKKLRDKYRMHTPITLLSNSSCLVKKFDIDTLSQIDVRIFKLDCADQETFEAINGPVSGIKIKDIIDRLVKLSSVLPVIIQTIFMDGPIKNYEDRIFDEWLAVIKKVKPQKIQIYSTDRPVATSNVKMVSDEKLEEIANIIREKSGIPTIAYKAQKKR
jgi:wyosine [tRNA(Phe)-imidazoG37] synthetase (radical SAM superfamily)